MFRWLEAHKIPLFIEQVPLSWTDLDWMAGAFPGMPIVLLDVTYRINRDLYPRLNAYPNLHVEISYLQQHRGIEDVCERFGPSRLLFGSKIPYLCPGSARHMVEKANVSAETKAAVAGDTLRSLMNGVRW